MEREAYKVKVVLDEIILERFYWQRPICHSRHELVLCVVFPRLLHVRSIKQVFDKAAAMIN